MLELGKIYVFAWANEDKEHFLLTFFDEKNEVYHYLNAQGNLDKFRVGSMIYHLSKELS